MKKSIILHNYLLPLQEKINDLNDSNRGTQVQEIEEHLLQYSNYFK